MAARERSVCRRRLISPASDTAKAAAVVAKTRLATLASTRPLSVPPGAQPAARPRRTSRLRKESWPGMTKTLRYGQGGRLDF